MHRLGRLGGKRRKWDIYIHNTYNKLISYFVISCNLLCTLPFFDQKSLKNPIARHAEVVAVCGADDMKRYSSLKPQAAVVQAAAVDGADPKKECLAFWERNSSFCQNCSRFTSAVICDHPGFEVFNY